MDKDECDYFDDKEVSMRKLKSDCRERNSVVYTVTPKFKFFPSVACFSLTGTIIKSKYNRKNTIDNTCNIILWNHVVKYKLLELSKYASIIIIADLTNKKIDTVKQIIAKTIQLLNVQCIFIASTKDNCYKKPNTNMWKIIKQVYAYKKKSIVTNKSIFIGNNAGRINRVYNDNSDVDRAFANNVNLCFSTPEKYFLDDETVDTWRWNKSIITMKQREDLYQESKKLVEPDVQKILFNLMDELDKNIFIIMILGLPCSGKKTLSKILKESIELKYRAILNNKNQNSGEESDDDDDDDDDIVIVDNIENNMNRTELKNMISILIQNKKSIIISGLFDTEYRRSQIINIAQKNEMPMLIVDIQTTADLSKLLHRIQLQTSKTHELIRKGDNVFYNYKKRRDKIEYEEDNIKYIKYPFIIKKRNEYEFRY